MKPLCAGAVLAVAAALAFPAPLPAQGGAPAQRIVAPPPILDLTKLLPPAGHDLGGWAPKGKPQIYKGEDLFLYIDGGAEIFHEYGFRQVITQDYANPAGKTVTLDIYEMATPESAYGMFTFKTGAGGRPMAIGREGRLEDYYLNFWKGRCLATLVGPDAAADTLTGLELIGKALDARIGQAGERPVLPEIFPNAWAASGRIVYLRGPLALQNVHAFFPRDIFQFPEGVASDQGPLQIFVFRYVDEVECAKRTAAVRDAFRKSSAYRNYRELPGAQFEVVDAKENAVFGAAFGDCLGLIVNRGSQKAAADIFDILRRGRAALGRSPGARR